MESVSSISEYNDLLQYEGQDKQLDASLLKDMRLFNTWNTTPEEKAKNLARQIPKSQLNQAINFIFHDCYRSAISHLLNAILVEFPFYNLSPFHSICRAIVEDELHSLTNRWLSHQIETYQLTNDEISKCYDLAYRMNNPYIYPLAKTPVSSKEYNLNFLWINLNPQDRTENVAQNIFGNGLNPAENAGCIKDPGSLRNLEEKKPTLKGKNLENWNGIEKSFMYKVSKWVDVNPNTEIIIWYDSALVTEKARKNTFEMVEAISESRGGNLKLRDIRQLPNLGGEIENCFHPGVPVYYRVDLLKALIADYMMYSSQSPKYCVISDADLEPMGPKQMFDQRTLDDLSDYGFVFNGVGNAGFENSFYIFNKDKEDAKEKHNKFILQKAVSYLTELRKYPVNSRIRPQYMITSQCIYNLYLLLYGSSKPRKIVKCPSSAFNSTFPSDAHQSETFRFIGESNIPYTRNGRNYGKADESPIEELVDWKAEPLPVLIDMPS